MRELAENIRVYETQITERGQELVGVEDEVESLKREVAGRRPTAAEHQSMVNLMQRHAMLETKLAAASRSLAAANKRLLQLETVTETKETLKRESRIARHMAALSLDHDDIERKLERHQDLHDDVEEVNKLVEGFNPTSTDEVDWEDLATAAWNKDVFRARERPRVKRLERTHMFKPPDDLGAMEEEDAASGDAHTEAEHAEEIAMLAKRHGDSAAPKSRAEMLLGPEPDAPERNGHGGDNRGTGDGGMAPMLLADAI